MVCSNFLRFAGALCLAWAVAANDACAREANATITGAIESAELREVSGIAASRINPGIVWTHNDGPTNRLFGVRTDGKTVAVLKWPSAVVDFEDIACGPGPTPEETYIYIGDIGDNEARRPQVRVYRAFEPPIGKSEEPRYLTVEVADFRFIYPDGPVDAEALLVDPIAGDILIVSKESKSARVFLARARQLIPNATVRLEEIVTLNIGGVSAGDISLDGRQIILRTDKDGWLWRRDLAQSVAETLSQPRAMKVPVRHKSQSKNGEGISFDPHLKGYFTISEGAKPPLAFFPLPTAK